ncbi:MAG: NAD(P)-dependent alcohol dehydrogenase [Thermoanaerobaculum sp.]|nr:NAD(P)-dependent alcohol dehydrogenase [Thermoanaerobaculum sp.]
MKVVGFAAESVGAELKPWEYTLKLSNPHEILVEVEACGICHSDIHMIDNDWRMSTYPLVPGHEVVGRVVELGSAVEGLVVGQRVGIGWQASACMTCHDCLSGNENLCDHHQGLIVAGKGGFASHVKVDGRFAFPFPEALPVEAGPLLCGGVTVYSALRHAGMTSGQRIGVIGLGGLGHLAVLFASRLGNQVTVFTTTAEKTRQAEQLGAAEVVVVEPGQSPPPPRARLDLLLCTVPYPQDWVAYLQWLGADGTLVLVAGGPKPLEIPFWALLGKRRRVMASPIGGRAVLQETLELAARMKVLPQVEVFPLSEVNRALRQVRENAVRFRAVLRAG